MPCSAGVLGACLQALTLSDLDSVPFSAAVLHEALRLYPPAGMTDRECGHDIQASSLTAETFCRMSGPKSWRACNSPFGHLFPQLTGAVRGWQHQSATQANFALATCTHRNRTRILDKTCWLACRLAIMSSAKAPGFTSTYMVSFTLLRSTAQHNVYMSLAVCLRAQ